MRVFEGQVGEAVVKNFRATPALKALADAAFIAMPGTGYVWIDAATSVAEGECEVPAKWVHIISQVSRSPHG